MEQKIIKIKDYLLVEVYQTDETKALIEEEYKGASIPVFE